ncbi:Protein srek1IP1 [Mortierella claussenii]|nr:Protein srek1IP1 [Mortierella claussenii]
MAIGAKVQASKLSPVLSEDKIRMLFEQIGPLDNLVLIPSPLGSGFEAIIEYRDKDSALVATQLTGTLFGGRPLTVTQMDVTLPPTPAGSNAGVRSFTNLTMQQQHAQQQANASISGGNGGLTPNSNPMIRMGNTTINHPQYNGMGGMGMNMGMGMGMGMPLGNQFQPMYPSPHMTLYNPNIMPQQYQQQQRPMDQQVDLDKVDTKTVYVGNLPLTVTQEQLEEIFQDCGKITRVNIAGKPTHPTRFAFMDFDTVDGAKKALSSTDKTIGDRRLRVNLPRHSGPIPFMMQQAQMMQPPQLQQTSALDATRTRYKNILIGLVNRGGDPSLLKKLEELEAGGPLPDLSDIPGFSAEAVMASAEGSPARASTENGAGGGGSVPTAASILEKLVSASRRRSRSRSSSTRRRSRSRSMDRDRDRDYYRRSSRRRSPSPRAGYGRSARPYDADYGRYDYRERERSERHRGYSRERERERERDRDRERVRDRDRERERPRERERDRDRDRERHSDRHRSHRDRDSERRPKSIEGDKAAIPTDIDVRMTSPPASDKAIAEK